MYYNQRSASRSSSRPRTASHSRSSLFNTFEIVQFINSTEMGKVDLRTIRAYLDQRIQSRSSLKLKEVWNYLINNKDNFIISDPTKDPQHLTGNETIWVRTVLSLCKTHCRRGKDGRNRACDGDCGALHVCRTFLLRSESACPFNSKKKRCMFGHNFFTEHNVELLKEHNLFGLQAAELQRLFRRRPSRTASTLPEVCIYYNKVDGKRCSRENCKALHLCLDFIQQCCEGPCSRNHKLTTPQVQRVFELFAIDKTWSPESLLEDLQHYMTTRHRAGVSSDTFSQDSDESGDSESGSGGHLAEGFSDPPFGQIQSCKGCEDLKLEVSEMQQTIAWLKSQVTDLRKIVDDKKNNSASNASPVLQLKDMGQVSTCSLSYSPSGDGSEKMPEINRPRPKKRLWKNQNPLFIIDRKGKKKKMSTKPNKGKIAGEKNTRYIWKRSVEATIPRENNSDKTLENNTEKICEDKNSTQGGKE